MKESNSIKLSTNGLKKGYPSITELPHKTEQKTRQALYQMVNLNDEVFDKVLGDVNRFYVRNNNYEVSNHREENIDNFEADKNRVYIEFKPHADIRTLRAGFTDAEVLRIKKDNGRLIIKLNLSGVEVSE